MARGRPSRDDDRPGRVACLAVLLIAAALPAVATPAPVAPGDTSFVQALPFRLIVAPDGRFAASQLSLTFNRDPTPFLTGVEVSHLDLDVLDAHGTFPLGDVPADSTAKRLYRARSPANTAQLTPAEKKEAVPPQPGAHAGIPSSVAVTGTLLGGLALLVKFLADFF